MNRTAETITVGLLPVIGIGWVLIGDSELAIPSLITGGDELIEHPLALPPAPSEAHLRDLLFDNTSRDYARYVSLFAWPLEWGQGPCIWWPGPSCIFGGAGGRGKSGSPTCAVRRSICCRFARWVWVKACA